MLRARYALFDSYQRLSPRPYVRLPVTVIDIDDESLAKLGQWPWPRTQIAALTRMLDDLGAAAIAFDIVFAEEDRTSPARLADQLAPTPETQALRDALYALPDHDLQLAAAFGDAPVVLGYALTADDNGVLPATKAAIATVGPSSQLGGDQFGGAVANLPALELAARGNGSLTIVADHDDVIRRVPLLQHIGDAVVPSLSVEALRVALGVKTLKIRFQQDKGLLRIGDLDVPFDQAGKMTLRFRDSMALPPLPAWQLFDQETAGSVASQVKDHIVLIGTGAAGLKDLRNTPIETFAAGVTVHAQAIEQMMTGNRLTRPVWLGGVGA